jgi:hypothetical protein
VYYPYFRGKQYELLAIRKNTDYMRKHSITPIIEPVKDIKEAELTNLERCLSKALQDKLSTIVIVNPQIGELAANQDSGIEKIINLIKRIECGSFDSADRVGICIGIIVNSTTNLGKCYRQLTVLLPNPHDIAFIHETATDSKEDLEQIAQWAHSILHISPEKSYVRQYSFFNDGRNNQNIVKLSDPFAGFRKLKNVEYRNGIDSIFTTENIFYSEDNYTGYSDYLTIGKDYSEGGGLPNAVAIHLTYKTNKDRFVHIQHFVSEANNDTRVDVAGKANEAISRLNDFVRREGLPMNNALEKFAALEAEERFPGLGVLKELSMTNHLFVAGETRGQDM